MIAAGPDKPVTLTVIASAPMRFMASSRCVARLRAAWGRGFLVAPGRGRVTMRWMVVVMGLGACAGPYYGPVSGPMLYPREPVETGYQERAPLRAMRPPEQEVMARRVAPASPDIFVVDIDAFVSEGPHPFVYGKSNLPAGMEIQITFMPPTSICYPTCGVSFLNT